MIFWVSHGIMNGHGHLVLLVPLVIRNARLGIRHLRRRKMHGHGLVLSIAHSFIRTGMRVVHGRRHPLGRVGTDIANSPLILPLSIVAHHLAQFWLFPYEELALVDHQPSNLFIHAFCTSKTPSSHTASEGVELGTLKVRRHDGIDEFGRVVNAKGISLGVPS